jgi:MFS family permease
MSGMDDTSRPAPPRGQKPTRTRYWVVVFSVTLAVLAYIDRACISMAAPFMRKDLNLSAVEMGYVFSAFALAYALFEIPGGWMGDWLGPKKVLIRIVLWWSAFTALTGKAWNMTSLIVIRFLFGAGEAGCFPNLTKAMTIWLPQREKVKAQGVMWAFARWGGAFTPPLMMLVITQLSWRWAFGLFGALGLVWCAFFVAFFKDNPREHKRVNAAELALLEGSEKLSSGHARVPWGRLVTSPTVWMLWAQYFLISYPFYFYLTWMPTYLIEGRHMDAAQASRFAVFPLLFAGTGSLVSGLLSDKVSKWTGSVSLARRVLDDSPHVFLVGAGAEQFAQEVGIPFCAPADLIIERERRAWAAQRAAAAAGFDPARAFRPHAADTVGAAARDAAGDLAAGNSTGGVMFKHPGRVGDTPLIGAGLYADNLLGAAVCTGWGEQIMKAALAKTAADQIALLGDAQTAADIAIAYFQHRLGGLGGVIALSPTGQVGLAHSTPCLAHAYRTAEMPEVVAAIRRCAGRSLR